MTFFDDMMFVPAVHTIFNSSRKIIHDILPIFDTSTTFKSLRDRFRLEPKSALGLFNSSSAVDAELAVNRR